METYTASDGQVLHVKVLGQGPPVVFLHAWAASHQDWLQVANTLAEGYQCFCWDARGHGGHETTVEDGPGVIRMADDLNDLIHHFRLNDPLLLGHSMGALTLWEYIRRHGCDGIGKLCLVDQSPRLLTDESWHHGIYGDFSQHRNETFVSLMKSDFVEAVLRLMAEGNNLRAREGYQNNSRGFKRLGEYILTLDPVPLIQIWKSLCLADYRDVLPGISVPTLLIHGDESHFYSTALADYVRDNIPGAQLHLYEGSDHSPHLWQRERFIEDVRRFAALGLF
ncbi:MAG: alpha/beta hydrolase [Gammaproteobacteria bacterium]|nr:alpha/beta hydrolase [Gammaproteobacteria bacterium]